MIELTDQQQRLLDQRGWPPRVVNPRTRESYVLIPAAMFERVREILEAEDEVAAVEETYPLTHEVLEADEAASRESA